VENMHFTLPKREMEEFCRRWKVREIAVFGSALRQDFSTDSDVDVLVDFQQDADWSLLEHVQMECELERLLQRKVDLITKRALMRSPNWVIRREILRTARVVFPVSEESDVS
jgi:predicted nucleotidyltransferase